MAEHSGGRLGAAVAARSRALARRVHLHRWWFQAIWLVYLANPVGATVRQPWPPAVRIALAGGIAAFGVGHLWCCALAWDPRDRPSRRLVLPAGMLAIALTVALTVGEAGLWMFVYVGCAAVLTAPAAWTRRVIAGVLAVVLGAGLANGARGGNLVLALVITLFTSLMVAVFRGREHAREQLREARETLARLAVNEERLRLARDLHDLLGHSLSLITLKSELAGRFLPADPAAAAQQVADIERVSRQALVDVREAVSGYRRPTLEVELARADHALAAARIEFANEIPAGDRADWLPPAREAALAWALREAVTNVVRHSQARRCWVRLAQRAAELMLEVADDGRGAATAQAVAGQHGAGQDGAAPYGNGLSGLYERLALEGGRLETEATGDGFRLRAFVPVGEPAAAPA